MFVCKICASNCSDIDSLMDHMTEHIRNSSETETYSDKPKNKKVDTDSKRTSHKDEKNKSQLDCPKYNGKRRKYNCDTITAMNILRDKQSNDTTSISYALQSNDSVNDVSSDYIHNKSLPQNIRPPGYISNAVNKNCITSNTENSDVENAPIKRKAIRCYYNKRKNIEKNSQFIQSQICSGNIDTEAEEIDTLLTVKQEDLSTTLTEALKFYSNNKDKTEASSGPKLSEVDNHEIVDVDNTQGSQLAPNNNDMKASIDNITHSRINFDSDDEIDPTVLSCIKPKQKRLHPCNLCNEAFVHKRALSIHWLQHRGKKPFSCDICGNDYSLISELNFHKKKHIVEKYFCEVCHKQCANKRALRQHSISHTSKNVECEICERKFFIYEQLKRHMAVHTGEKRYSCIECDMPFRNYSSLSLHRDAVHRQIQHKCPVCYKLYSCTQSLLKHIEFMHSNPETNKCNVCNAVFKYPDSLKRHMGKHNGYPLKCSICGKGFTYNSQLERHQLVHSRGQFQCDNCKVTFKKKESMANHIVNRKCDKEYVLKKRSEKKLMRRLQRGRRRRKKQFQCNKCNKMFTTKKYLVVHLLKCEKKRGKRKSVLKTIGKR